MIANLFSVFDPSTRVGVNLNWATMVLRSLMYPMAKWRRGSRVLSLFNTILRLISKEINPILTIKRKSHHIIFVAVFIFILWNNLLGLLPFVFTPTRHLAITLRIALPLWLGYFRYGIVNNLTHILAHLTPQGTPALLLPFIVIVESVRGLIRPVTLAVRLMANMIAGHLLLTLIRRAIQVFSITSVVLIVFIQILLIILEVAVAAIQSYVLVILSALYVREV